MLKCQLFTTSIKTKHGKFLKRQEFTFKMLYRILFCLQHFIRKTNKISAKIQTKFTILDEV